MFLVLCLVTQSCPTLCNPMDCSPLDSSVHGDSPGKNTGVGCHALLQGIFPNPSLPHCRHVLCHLSHQGSPPVQFSHSVMSYSVSPWTAARQTSLSITSSQSLLILWSIELVMPSNHLILCRPLLLPSVSPRIRVFSNKSVLCIRWPKYWSFSFSISPSSEYSRLIFFRTGLISLLSKGFSRVFSNTTVQKHQFFSAPLSL